MPWPKATTGEKSLFCLTLPESESIMSRGSIWQVARAGSWGILSSLSHLLTVCTHACAHTHKSWRPGKASQQLAQPGAGCHVRVSGRGWGDFLNNKGISCYDLNDDGTDTVTTSQQKPRQWCCHCVGAEEEPPGKVYLRLRYNATSVVDWGICSVWRWVLGDRPWPGMKMWQSLAHRC